MTLTVLFGIYLAFVILRDWQDVSYKVWALCHNHILKPLSARQGRLIQYASNSTPPFRFMKSTQR